jgi:hypothetical protein
MTPTVSTPAAPNPLKVGEEVILRVAGSERRGVVVEDRGPLDVDGGQIVAIRVGKEDENRRFEVQAKYLERAAA